MCAEIKAMPYTRIMSKLVTVSQCDHQHSDRCNVANVESWDTDCVLTFLVCEEKQ